MKAPRLRLAATLAPCALGLILGVPFATAQTRVMTAPLPAGEAPGGDFDVQADGHPVAVYGARTLDPPFAGKEWDYGGDYAFASFDADGPVTVRIASKRSLAHAVVRPSSPAVKVDHLDEHTLVLSLDGPRKLSIEPDGKRSPLLLFANPPEVDAPREGDPGVVYFGPGVHKPEKIELGPDQTLYLAAGSVVKANVLVRGSRVRIRGRGVLDGSDWEWRRGPFGHTLGIHGSEDVEVEGIVIRGSSHWTIVPVGSRKVTVRNVKICGSRVQNDDGINPCNSQDVLITDCFIRSDDDCVALKGLDASTPNNNVERITVENSILWCDRARIFLLGHESRADFMRDVTLRDLDVIHFTMTAFLFEPGEEMRLEGVRVEDVRLHGEGNPSLLRLKPVVNQYMRTQVPGFVKDVSFRNVVLEGEPGAYRVELEGADPTHDVRDVSFQGVEILGRPIAADSEFVKIGPNVSGVTFRPGP